MSAASAPARLSRRRRPSSARLRDASPIHPGQLHRASCRLDEPNEYVVVVAKRTAGLNSLEHQVIRTVGLHDLVLANRIAGPNLDSQSLKPMDTVNDAAATARAKRGAGGGT